MARRQLIAANWKMYKNRADAEAYARKLAAAAGSCDGCDLLVCPPFLALPAVATILEGTGVAVGAQDLFWETEGAFTGEISGAMVRDAGGTAVLVGHSERRWVIGEDEATIARKLSAALNADLTPILCVGERLEDREAGGHESVVAAQLASALDGHDAAACKRLVVAYEPVWAIGTGKTATPVDAEAMHAVVRAWMAERFGAPVGDALRIQYGGSVKPENAAGLLGRADIDGALIGGASLQVDSFLAIARAARR